MNYRISRASIVEWARLWARYDKPKFHAALMDAPYHLTNDRGQSPSGTYSESFGGYGKQLPLSTAGKNKGGFMGKSWDGGDVAFQVDTWRAVYDVLMPGAFMFVFGGSRTVHRMAVAIEDSGFVLHPTICWVFGSGFPKAQRIDTQIDKAAGAEREVVGDNPNHRSLKNELVYCGQPHSGSGELTAPATPLAQAWEGHRYGKQSLKPAAEFIICAQRPYEGRPVDSIVASGAGSLNIEAGRIGVAGGGWGGNPSEGYHGNLQGGESYNAGRWPANVALTHAPDCTPSQCSPGCAVEALSQGDEWEPQVSRYFHNSDYYLETAERIAAADPMMYAAKADRWQREAGLTGEAHMTPGVYSGRADGSLGKKTEPRLNHHPTQKPLALCHWLASLLLPPDAYAPRRLLIPFCGAGSEIIGAALAGFEHVQGVEIVQEYIDIAHQRIDFWQQYAGMDYETARGYAEAKQDELERKARMDAPLDDLPLFGGLG